MLASRSFGEVDVDFEWRSSFGELGERRYLDTHAIGPTIGTLVGESLYLSAGYRYEYRDAHRSHPLVTSENDRTANRNTLRADGLLIFADDGIRLGLGGFYRDESATQLARFDYDSLAVRAHASWRLPVEGIGFGPPELALRFRHEARRYEPASRVRTSAGPRRDDRSHVSASIELPLFHRLFGRLTYEHFRSESNDPSADYDSNVARLQLEARY